jgi:hypothetical protein
VIQCEIVGQGLIGRRQLQGFFEHIPCWRSLLGSRVGLVVQSDPAGISIAHLNNQTQDRIVGTSLVNRKVIVVLIAVVVGLLHFVTGPSYRGPFPAFVNGYLIDILLPFSMFLLLGVAELPILSGGLARGAIVFAIGAASETLQYFGVPIFGQTFDPLDYLMFGVGIGLAALFEKLVLSRIPRATPSRIGE